MAATTACTAHALALASVLENETESVPVPRHLKMNTSATAPTSFALSTAARTRFTPSSPLPPAVGSPVPSGATKARDARMASQVRAVPVCLLCVCSLNLRLSPTNC